MKNNRKIYENNFDKFRQSALIFKLMMNVKNLNKNSSNNSVSNSTSPHNRTKRTVGSVLSRFVESEEVKRSSYK